jgi:iron complex transport system ATP-binding protein
LLRAADLWFAYGRSAVLQGIDLDVRAGAIVGILGPNGSGKSTLLRLLMGSLTPSRGKVLLDGADLRQYRRAQLARRMAFVPQDTHLAFDYTVLELALMGRYPHLGTFEIEGPADIQIVRDALALTGTAAFENRRVSTLSGGEKQRVIIASALAQMVSWIGPAPGGHPAVSIPPEDCRSGLGILLLDEPTASLDLRFQLEVAAILERLNAERNTTIVLTTHDVNLAASLCRDLVLLRDGQVQASGPVDEVLTREAVAALYDVEADVRFDETAGHLTVIPRRGRIANT